LRDTVLSKAVLVGTNLSSCDLSGATVYGIAAWNIELTGATQLNLRITPPDEPEITVDDMKVAQFAYLILHNAQIRDVIDTVAEKAVLILGRFTPERKRILDGLRDALREHNFVPMVFDFDRAVARDFTETLMTLAGMSLFIIADVTNPRSAPLELQAAVPNYMIPFVPII
jgi:hypothetical protein